MDILNRIVEDRKLVIEAELIKYGSLKSKAMQRDFAGALWGLETAVVAEIKYASPSQGNFGVAYTPEKLARFYEQGGAKALSVLACETHFEGSPEFVMRAKEATSLPVLWKDFVFDFRQLSLAVSCGADAILLICAVLGEKIQEFIVAAQEVGLQAVVEVYDEAEANIAKAAGAKIILINNRNLRDFKVDLNVSKNLAKVFPPETLVISASGIKNRDDIEYLQKSGLHAFLVGESVACAEHPDEAVQKLMGK
jgi:indole-3-glycerol phosphate synthase